MTVRLYYEDAHRPEFTARVLSCREAGGRWLTVTDRTAFFPEGGGQPGDRGVLGGTAVLDVHEKDGEIVHICAGPLPEGETVSGAVDWPLRFERMQIHSGEHIVSGHAHALWGCENVGFHMTERCAVIDFDKELNADELARLERLANETVWADLPVNVLYPTAEELERIPFRQKKELSGQIRLVEIPGVDVCACCAPHVKTTGQIGLIRITDAMRHRGGVRLTLTAGAAALENAAALERDAGELSRLFSAPRTELPAAAQRLLSELEKQKALRAELEKEYVSLLAGAAPAGDDICLFPAGEVSAAAMRLLAEKLTAGRAGLCGVFVSAGDGWRYVIASRSADLRARTREINGALRGRGGGSAEMIQGSASASRQEIEAYFGGIHG